METDSQLETRSTIRPTAVTILGWVFLVFSSFALLCSFFLIALMNFITRVAPEGEFPPRADQALEGFGVFAWMFEHFQALAVIQAIGAAFSIYAAFMFLKLKPWSRTYFEFVNWFLLAWTAVFCVVFAISWVGIASSMPAPINSPAPPPALFGAFGVFAAIFGGLFNAAFPAACVWLLRSKFVRPVFSPPAQLLRATPLDG